MSYFLSELPLWALILAVVVIPTSVAIGFQIFVRRSVGVEKLALNNEVAGFIFAIIGVVYAVLLAFVVIAVWDKFSEGQTSVARESAAAAALLYYSEGAEPEAAQAARKPCSISQARYHKRLACNGDRSPRTPRRLTLWGPSIAPPWRSIARARAAFPTCRRCLPKLTI